MNNDEIKKIQKSLDATMAVEGLKVSTIGKEINKKFLAGSISSGKAITLIINYHLNKKGGVVNG